MEEAIARIDTLLDEERSSEALRQSWASYANTLESKASVIVVAEKQPNTFRAIYLIDGKLYKYLPIKEGVLAPNRWTASPLAAKKMARSEPQFVPRAFYERRRYPTPAAVNFYAQFDYEGWLDFPILIEGRFYGKVGFMFNGPEPSIEFLQTFWRELQPLMSRWLIIDRLAADRALLVDRVQKQLAGDLHDTVLNSISGIIAQTEDLRSRIEKRDPSSAQTITRIQKLAAEGLGESRRVLASLSDAPVKKNEHLVQRFRHLASSITVPGRVSCRFLTLGAVPWMDDATAEEILAIGKEAISNAILRGHATQVVARLNATARHFSLVIQDNGQGLSTPAKRSTGLGLASIRIRAARIGGRIRYLSTPKGTGVGLRLKMRGSSKRPLGPTLRANSRKIRAFLVDDHALVREGIRSYLSRSVDIEVCGEAGTAREALALLPRVKPDVILVDLRLPDQDGLALMRGILSENPEAKLIALTVVDSDEMVAQCTDAGARGYLLKSVSPASVREAIRHVQAGGSYFSSELLPRLGNQIGKARLSAREIEIVSLVAKGKSNKEIAQVLGVSLSTTKTHLERAFQKLGATSRTEAARTAIARGLIEI